VATPLTHGQPITREAAREARVPGGGFLRDEGAVEVYVLCACCGEGTKTWITPRYSECPPVYCGYCDWLFDQEYAETPL
jgi:hypothetical protein